ncbi:MAG: aminofutalosine synthase MqnE, partial [Bacteroidales bacterium]
TMLFGHIEERWHRVEHMLMIRDLQDITGGFDAFIPLKYRVSNNELGKGKKEVDIIEVLKTFAISRLALNNIPHIKSYWPMLGKELCQLSLLFGADDIDGTINDSTKIYSMAGAEEKSPILLASELASLAEHAGFIAVERDSYYNIL